jgi:hypothetical protein
VWTGRELLVWGGLGVPGDGAAYDPSANTWRVLAKAPLGSRIANAVWTGTEMVIRAGRSGNGNGVFAYSNAAAYNPATDTWRQLADGPAHPGFQAVWTGQGLLMFAKGSGVRFTSETGWQDLPHAGFTVPTEGTVVWTGREAVLAGVVSSRIAVVSYTP